MVARLWAPASAGQARGSTRRAGKGMGTWRPRRMGRVADVRPPWVSESSSSKPRRNDLGENAGKEDDDEESEDPLGAPGDDRRDDGRGTCARHSSSRYALE